MQIERAVLAIQEQVCGPSQRSEVAAIDGRAVRGSQGEQVLTAAEVPSLRYLGSAPVPADKTNEIPVARELFKRLDLEGRLVGLDALHTQMESNCQLVQEHGADHLLTVRDNQKGLRRAIRSRFTAVPAVFPPQPPPSTQAWGEEHGRYAVRFLFAERPAFKERSWVSRGACYRAGQFGSTPRPGMARMRAVMEGLG